MSILQLPSVNEVHPRTLPEIDSLSLLSTQEPDTCAPEMRYPQARESVTPKSATSGRQSRENHSRVHYSVESEKESQ